MANDLNQCNFIGRLGADPDSRFTPAGDQVTKINLACGWKGKNSEGVEWVRVVFFGKLAEIAEKYLVKGAQVYVNGRMKTKKYTDSNGVEKYATEIVGNNMQMLGSGQGGGSEGSQQAPENRGPQQASGNGSARPPITAKDLAQGGGVDDDPFDDGIPF